MKFRKLIGGAFGAAGLLCGVSAQAVQAARIPVSTALVDFRWRVEGRGRVESDDMTKQGYTWKDFRRCRRRGCGRP